MASKAAFLPQNFLYGVGVIPKKMPTAIEAAPAARAKVSILSAIVFLSAVALAKEA